jgi:ribosomal protein S18 acetylase RimI-like enzyme
MPPVSVKRTYLEMTSPGDLTPAPTPLPEPRVERIAECPVSFFRFLYAEVGRQYHWTDRHAWSDARIRSHVADPAVSLWLLSWRGAPAGYFELMRHGDDSIEIAYFGLLPEFTGRGWGRYLLTRAVEAAWAQAPRRVWLHTCTLDHPAALAAYRRAGFAPCRRAIERFPDPRLLGILPRDCAPQVPLLGTVASAS